MTEAPTYRLVLRPLPDPSDADGIRRLRMALKALLRSYRLRCCAIEAVTAEDVATADRAEQDRTEASI
jgi:hypothetical protein